MQANAGISFEHMLAPLETENIRGCAPPAGPSCCFDSLFALADAQVTTNLWRVCVPCADQWPSIHKAACGIREALWQKPWCHQKPARHGAIGLSMHLRNSVPLAPVHPYETFPSCRIMGRGRSRAFHRSRHDTRSARPPMKARCGSVCNGTQFSPHRRHRGTGRKRRGRCDQPRSRPQPSKRQRWIRRCTRLEHTLRIGCSSSASLSQRRGTLGASRSKRAWPGKGRRQALPPSWPISQAYARQSTRWLPRRARTMVYRRQTWRRSRSEPTCLAPSPHLAGARRKRPKGRATCGSRASPSTLCTSARPTDRTSTPETSVTVVRISVSPMNRHAHDSSRLSSALPLARTVASRATSSTSITH